VAAKNARRSACGAGHRSKPFSRVTGPSDPGAAHVLRSGSPAPSRAALPQLPESECSSTVLHAPVAWHSAANTCLRSCVGAVW